jgi:hypothetical protein
MTQAACFPEKLVIVSHVVHYKHAGRFYAYAPYAREIEIWADMFEDVLIAAPCREQEPPGDCALLDRGNLSIAPQREFGGETLAAKAKLLFALPLLSWELARAVRSRSPVLKASRSQVCRAVECKSRRARELPIATRRFAIALVGQPRHGVWALAR